MSAVAYAQAPAPGAVRARQPHLFAVGRPEPTLAEALAGLWTELRAGGQAECGMCGGAMAPRWSAGHGVVGARCTSCGTELD